MLGMLVLMAMNGILDLLNLLGKDKSRESGRPFFLYILVLGRDHSRLILV